MVPDRIDALIKRLEAGETVTQEQVDRIAQLQMLDLARAGRDILTERLTNERDQTEMLRQALEA